MSDKEPILPDILSYEEILFNCLSCKTNNTITVQVHTLFPCCHLYYQLRFNILKVTFHTPTYSNVNIKLAVYMDIRY